jgi:hypothetical protein
MMSTLFGTSSVRDDPEHWDAVAERVAGIVARRSKRGGVDWLTRSRAALLSACFLLAVVVLAIFSKPEKIFGAGPDVEWVQAFAPADDIGAMIAWPDRPPALGALLFAGGSRR